ncbi:FkbM family methyltransferase [Novosphingobium aquae]|uniref:FkbM family methyltransferase n=1 Tax=Novosphingobium aquae TaxID=3133435 RepID=A0ABU8SFA0_9SPHN
MIKSLSALRDLRLERGHSFLASLVTPGGLVIDAGAHLCEFANAMAEKYGVSVISLEPNEALSPDYIDPRVTLLRAALAAGDGEAVFAIDDNPEASRIIQGEGSEVVTGKPVQTRSLASLLGEFDATEVQLLKLDVEGAEYEVLLQAPRDIFARFKQISVEFHPFDARHPADLARIRAVIDRMRELGFDGVRCSFRGFGDYLFVNSLYPAAVNRAFFPVARKFLERRT